MVPLDELGASSAHHDSNSKPPELVEGLPKDEEAVTPSLPRGVEHAELLDRLSDHIMRNRYRYATLGIIGIPICSGMTNISHGSEAVVHAAITQFIHTASSTLAIFTLHSSLTKHPKQSRGMLPALIPATVSSAICYALHKLGIPGLQTPSAEPALSTVPTIFALSVVVPAYHWAFSRQQRKVAQPSSVDERIESGGR